MYKLTYTIIALFVCMFSVAQTKFITAGKIEYERKTKQHAFMDEGNMWDEMAKKNLPKFVTYYYDLVFKDDRSVYKVGREPDVKQNKFWGIFDSENIILT